MKIAQMSYWGVIQGDEQQQAQAHVDIPQQPLRFMDHESVHPMFVKDTVSFAQARTSGAVFHRHGVD